MAEWVRLAGRIEPLAGRVGRCASWWRTLRGCGTAVRHLDRLALASARLGYRGMKVYPDRCRAVPFPLLLVYAHGVRDDVAVLATARAVPGGWAYFDAFCDPWFRIASCRDVVAAAERVAALLKHQMYPGTFPDARCGKGAR